MVDKSNEIRPWLEYSGQSASELIASKHTHRVDSLLYALEEGIKLRQTRHGKKGTTREERVLLAVMALNQEVTNGGYGQFFLNSSREFAPMIVAACKRISCDTTARLTANAIHTLGLAKVTPKAVADAMLKPDAKRDQILDDCDRDFYKLKELDPNLFHFVESHREQFILEKTSMPLRAKEPGNPKVILLHKQLGVKIPKTDHSLDALRREARELASQKSLNVTDAEIDAASYLYQFGWFLRKGDLDACEVIAPRAFDLAREITTHCERQHEFVGKLLKASKYALADAITLQYVQYLNNEDKTVSFVRNWIVFWAGLIGRYPGVLPRSAEFFRASFPDVSLSLRRWGQPD